MVLPRSLPGPWPRLTAASADGGCNRPVGGTGAELEEQDRGQRHLGRPRRAWPGWLSAPVPRAATPPTQAAKPEVRTKVIRRTTQSRSTSGRTAAPVSAPQGSGGGGGGLYGSATTGSSSTGSPASGSSSYSSPVTTASSGAAAPVSSAGSSPQSVPVSTQTSGSGHHRLRPRPRRGGSHGSAGNGGGHARPRRRTHGTGGHGGGHVSHPVVTSPSERAAPPTQAESTSGGEHEGGEHEGGGHEAAGAGVGR